MRTFSAAAFLLLCAASSTVLDASAQSRVGHRAIRGASLSLTDVVRRTSPPIAVARGGGYCAASAEGSVDFGLDERIINVTFAGINNTSPNTAPTLPAYTYYPNAVANVTAGQSYPISIGVSSSLAGGTSFSEDQALAWIDLNQDQDFDDAGEQVFVSAIEATAAYTGTISIPANATLGVTRMRIRLHDTHDGSQYINVFNDTPCGVASYGEIEDYSVNISGGGGGSNDDCANVTADALSVGGSVVFNGDNSNAIPGGDGLLDVGGDTTTVWHAFTITECANITLAYCGTPTAPSNYWAALFSDCPAGNNYILYSDGNFDDCGDQNLTLFFNDVPAGTYYVPVRGEPDTDGPYVVTVSAEACATAGPYCEAGAVSTQFEKISNVTTAGINNNSTSSAGYEDFTAGTPGAMTAGGSFPVSVSISGGYATDEVRIWIDFDQSESFEAGELVFTSALGVGPHAGTINVPGGAATGATRMRVRLHDTYDLGVDYFNTPNPTPCDTSTFGQVEDYTINITGGGNAPANDECTGAVGQSLAVGGSVVFNGDNTGATDTEGLGIPSVWESFTTTECANITIAYCGTTPAFTNAFLNLFIGCPFTGFIQSTSFETTSCGDNNVTIQYNNVPAGTYYYAVLTDVGATGPYTITVSAVACPPPDDYCTAGAVSVQFEKISNVTFADINNTSAGNAGYEDFTAQTASVVGGVSYPISVTIAGGYATDQVLAWIDWDHSSTFEAGEQVFVSAIGVGPHTGSVAVPLTATAGPTRMRVRLHDTYDLGVDYFNTPNPTPCDTSTFGQVEDYTVDMIGIITGVSEANAGSWSVFPNPNNGDFVVRYAGRDGRATIEVLDMTGRMVHAEQRAVAAGGNVQISLADKLAAGTYALRITTVDGSEERRIVVH